MSTPVSHSDASADPYRAGTWRPLLTLLGLFAALYCINLFIPRDLWIQDEARYGEVVREMLTTGQWLIPHLNGHFYPDKPALYFWLVAAVGGVVGQGILAFRLVTLLSTLAAVYGVWLVGQRLTDRVGAWWSAAIFASTFLTLFVGQMARMDMLLTASVAFAWYALLSYWQGGRPRALVGFWGLAILGVAIKGPIALLFTVLPALAWSAHEGGWRGLRRLRPLLGLGAFIAVIAAWIGIIVVRGEGHYLWEIWHDQLVGRAVNSWSHREPIYFYVVLAPLLLMPWTGLVVRGGYRLWRERPDLWKAVAWFALLPLAAVSLISGKLFIYIEPLFPALCIAAGVAAARLWREPRPSFWISLPPVVFLGAAVAAVLWANRTLLDGAQAGQLLAGALALLSALGLALAFVNGRRWLLGWSAISVGISVCVFGVLIYLLNPLYSGRAIGEAIARLAPADRPVGGHRPARAARQTGRRGQHHPRHPQLLCRP
ncbi:MAG: glycosyltransferase family 39 protein [Gammaproteobacteria bacterium]